MSRRSLASASTCWTRGSIGACSRWTRVSVMPLLHLSLHLLFQLGLARGHLLAEGLEVQVGLADLREHLLFLFLDVVADVFAQHRDLGVVELLARLHAFD